MLSAAAEKILSLPEPLSWLRRYTCWKEEKTVFFFEITYKLKSSKYLINCNSRHCLGGELESSYYDK